MTTKTISAQPKPVSKTANAAIKLSPEEACRRARAEALLIADYHAKLARKRDVLMERMENADAEERESIGSELATLNVNELFADHAINAARDNLRALAPRAVVHVATLVDKLSAIHLQCGEIVRKQVEQAVHGALSKKGWWTFQELNWLIPRSQPMRAQHVFEQEHYANLGIGLVSMFDEETKATFDTFSEEVIKNPASFVGAQDRLIKSIAAAEQRLAELTKQPARP